MQSKPGVRPKRGPKTSSEEYLLKVEVKNPNYILREDALVAGLALTSLSNQRGGACATRETDRNTNTDANTYANTDAKKDRNTDTNTDTD